MQDTAVLRGGLPPPSRALKILVSFVSQAPMDPLGNVIVDDRLATSCGKLMLLGRMLNVLKKGGHKVI